MLIRLKGDKFNTVFFFSFKVRIFSYKTLLKERLNNLSFQMLSHSLNIGQIDHRLSFLLYHDFVNISSIRRFKSSYRPEMHLQNFEKLYSRQKRENFFVAGYSPLANIFRRVAGERAPRRLSAQMRTYTSRYA